MLQVQTVTRLFPDEEDRAMLHEFISSIHLPEVSSP